MAKRRIVRPKKSKGTVDREHLEKKQNFEMEKRIRELRAAGRENDARLIERRYLKQKIRHIKAKLKDAKPEFKEKLLEQIEELIKRLD